MFTQYKKICSINVYINLFYETIHYFAFKTFLFDMKNSEKTRTYAQVNNLAAPLLNTYYPLVISTLRTFAPYNDGMTESPQ